MNIKEHKQTYKQIEYYATQLRLPAIRLSFEESIKQAQLKDASYEELILELLGKEWDKRQESGKETGYGWPSFRIRNT